MALDWNKEISLSTILDLARPGRKKGAGSGSVPTKTTMNLYQGEQKSGDMRKHVLLAILGVVVALAFVKFGVLDQFDKLARKQAQLAEQQALLDELGGGVENYQEVFELYEAYVKEYGTGKNDVISVLELVEKDVMPAAHVTEIVLAENTLTLNLEGVSLETVGDLAKKLEKNDMVVRTSVTSANTKAVSSQGGETQTSTSTIVVALASPATESEE
ncbi:MAG: hypothetical protein IKG21_08675 [Atopobiaceae bacterium]|nr:hypothetical protein [Atopobiaceae bacterium]